MQDFPSNSQKAKATDAPRDIKPVTSAKTGGRKEGLGRKFKRTFFAQSGKDVARYMVEDEIVPSIRDMIHNTLEGALHNLFYGDRSSGRRRPTSSSSNQATGNFNYGGIFNSSQPTKEQHRTLPRSSRARHDFQNLVIDSHMEANQVIDGMFDILQGAGQVTVADLYVLTNVKPEHTDVKWGWTNLGGARALRLKDGSGFVLNLPEPEALR